MPTNIVNELIRQVAELKTDMDWLKKAVYVCVAASLTAAGAALPQLIKSLIH